MTAAPTMLIEGAWHELPLTVEQADALAALGEQLASRRAWWRDVPDSSRRSRSAIDIAPTAKPGVWRVRVPSAVGTIIVGGSTMLVEPKIPPAQFLDLLAAGGGIARTAGDDVAAASGGVLWDLVATWFVDAAAHVVSHGLLRDYVEREDDLQLARGSIDQLRTTLAVATGRLAIACRYEEFELDTPLNRMLKVGLVAVTRGSGDELATRAARLLGDLRAVGEVRDADWHTSIDRRSHVYRRAVGLARVLVDGSATSLGVGNIEARCHLIPSPRVFEDGIRAIISEHLMGTATVRAERLTSRTGNIAFDPDIVVRTRLGETLVADVKYRSFTRDWPSDVRNQIVAFAHVARARRAAVIGIEHTPGEHPRSFAFERLEVRAITWQAWREDPRSSLLSQIDDWGRGAPELTV